MDVGKFDVRFWRPTVSMELKLSRQQVAMRDKVAFVVGVMLLWWAGFSLGAHPDKFYATYSRQCLALMAIRLVEFRIKKMHYYLFDFCYFANGALLVYCWFLSGSPLFMRTLFAYSNGPLAWSVVMFRNSLVFHSVAHLTSLFIHIFPPIVMWTIRWSPDVERFGVQERASLLELVLFPTVLYAVWAVLYYLKIFVLSSAKIQERGYETLFRFVTSSKNPISKAISRQPRPLQPIIFLGLHLTFTIATLLISVALWHSYYLHTAFLFFIFLWAAWKGSTYYFDVFAKKYVSSLAKL